MSQRGITGSLGTVAPGRVLAGARVVRLRTTPAGGSVVRLLEDRDGYRAGEVLHLGAGAFVKQKESQPWRS